MVFLSSSSSSSSQIMNQRERGFPSSLFHAGSSSSLSLSSFCPSPLLQRRLESVADAAGRGSVHDVARILEVDSDSASSVVEGPYARVQRIQLASTACIVACTNGHLGVVDYVLRLQAPHLDINFRDDDGDTALDIAVAGNYTEIVARLLQHPHLNVNRMDSYGWAPLHYAAHQGNVATVLVLLRDKRTNVNVTTNTTGWTALHVASERGHADVVDVLLQHPHTDWNLRTRDGKSAWEIARNDTTRRLIALLCSRLELQQDYKASSSSNSSLFSQSSALYQQQQQQQHASSATHSRMHRERTIVLLPEMATAQ